MTREEICKALENGGFILSTNCTMDEVYYHGEMEVSVNEYTTNIYMGSLETGLCTSLSYRNDELYKFDITEHQFFTNLLRLTIETNAGESIFCFK